jgi:DNA ligase 1
MRDRYPENSDNCSKLPLWGEVDGGDTPNTPWSNRSKANVCRQVFLPAFFFDLTRSGRYEVLSEPCMSPLSRPGHLIVSVSVTVSPVSVAAQGLVSESRGLSLRFPRFLRVREDKSVEQASSTDFLARMYREQHQWDNDLGGADDGHLIDPALSDTAMNEDWEDELD